MGRQQNYKTMSDALDFRSNNCSSTVASAQNMCSSISSIKQQNDVT